MNLETLCKTYKKTLKSIEEAKAVLNGNVSQKSNIAKELHSGIQSYLKQASSAVEQIIRISNGDLIVRNGRVYHKSVKKSFSITVENAYDITKNAISNFNKSVKFLSIKGYNSEVLEILGESMLSLYAVYDKIEEVEEKYNKNLLLSNAKRDEAQMQLNKLECDLDKIVENLRKLAKSQKNDYANYSIDDYMKNPITPDYRIPLGCIQTDIDEDFMRFIRTNIPDFSFDSGINVEISKENPSFFLETESELLDGSFF